MQQILVSVVIPTYNRVTLLKQCIGSLLLLAYPYYEIIVVDDGSVDETREFLAAMQDGVAIQDHIAVVRQSHRGPSSARNAGIAQAQGGIIAFTDDDCLVAPEWLTKLVVPFTDTRVVGVSGSVIYVSENYHPARGERVVENRDARWPMTANIAYRADVARAAGGFDETFDRYEDKEFALRMWQRGRIVMAPDAVVYHQKTVGAWPDLHFASASSAWVRLAARHDLWHDHNNPPPVFWRVLMPRKYVGLLWRLVFFPVLLLFVLTGARKNFSLCADWARHHWRWLRFLIAERTAIWRAALQEKKFFL